MNSTQTITASEFRQQNRRPKHYKNLEAKLQEQCVRWFRLEYPRLAGCYFAIPNGGSRNPMEGANLKRQGVLAGVADTFLMSKVLNCFGLFIEFKIGKNNLTEHQQHFKITAQFHGYAYEIVRSFDEFKEVITKYLND